MKLLRRQFLRIAAGAAALPAVSRIALALDYPTRPVHVIVGYPPGSGPDIEGRLIAQWLSERLGQPFVVENRPGAASNIATEAVVHAPADGYTLLLVASANASNATLYDKLSFNFVRDIEPVASIMRAPFVMQVNPSFPAKTVPEFIAYAKANPGKINMASSGNGTLPHICGELLKMMTGINMTHVPYRGGAPAMVDLMSGQVQVGFSVVTETLQYLKAGKLRALAVTTGARSDVLPDIPTISEFVPGYEASAWVGIGAPKNTPTEIIEKLNADIKAGLADPKLKARFTDLGATMFIGSPADFGKFITDETEKWAKVVKFAGIKPN
jgi:tripartite-type tricarboxylate transporter receptor subunit TctC